ncbi:circadian locomoter output cycles protein kaput isoform X2 [Lingula anatina]|uniref:Circadian locomoter output cycles protein kaput isoform X2 n=1 Tax=Lingula anatina TaxID=7574 RepID=A0A1S3HEM5_LINAN|nr:circadian locomoter output cycles protein kaput isoform X2 [Lingula anatina]|eukprot:XP_013383489.1 circadian locomoter output cycles protein kaput isoform X2 [Lingula anatina]
MNGKPGSVKVPMKDPPKSNPSKRHRERLNAELDHLASLLPFEQSVISKLDKLSILRLSVSYLRTKSYFQAVLQNKHYGLEHHIGSHHGHLFTDPDINSEGECNLQALNGFLMVISCDTEVFYASRTVEQYLGFHQSDIIHQSVLELIHSEDREEFKRQLSWTSMLPPEKSSMTLQELMLAENVHLLHRSFTVRFRCLLDNTSGFITLEITGWLKYLHGQNVKSEEPLLALFATCCPFGPLPVLDMQQRDYTFKSKHKMDLSPVSIDHRGKVLFGYTDPELATRGGYDLIHPDDLNYYSAAHQELMKTGNSGLIAYRLMTKDCRWLWLQSSCKIIYKNSKPDFVLVTHRHLTDDEGKDLVRKRGTEFKLPYPIIDCGDTLSELGSPIEESPYSPKFKSQKKQKPNKPQLKDYLQTGRKRKQPYREGVNGLNGYSPYSPISGFTAAQNGDLKTAAPTELMYPYASNNFGLEADLYRSHSYHTAFATAGLYPSAADSYRIAEADKHTYPNGYYLEPRQYQHTLHYNSNTYPDLMATTSKYGYDVAKYGYDVSAYGHDKYGSDYRKYDFSNERLSHQMNGSFMDSMCLKSRISSSSSLLNTDGLVSTNISSNPCSAFRSDIATDRYDQHVSELLPRENGKKNSSTVEGSTSPKNVLPNGHGSVIINPKPKSVSRQNSIEALASTSTSVIQATSSSMPLSQSSVWSPCNRLTSPEDKEHPDLSRSSSHDQSNGSSPMASRDDLSPVALNSTNHNNSSSPVSATMATSVIQPTDRRTMALPVSQHKQPSSISGGIAVPVVKSTPWIHHMGLPLEHRPWTGSDTYGCPTTLRGGDTYQSSFHDARLSLKIDDRSGGPNPISPLLSFSEVTHTLLSSDQ